MAQDQFKNHVSTRVAPGYYAVTTRGEIISTLLGSCVAACVYDPVARVAGMNHFLLSNRRYARQLPYTETEAGRYGVQAMELLINDLNRAGARKERLCAKAFGGASIIETGADRDNFSCVGQVNIRFIQDFLDLEQIPLLSADLGGEHGRVIYFDTRDFSVYVRRIKKSRSIELAQRDHSLWQREIRAHDHAGEGLAGRRKDVELWG